MTKKFWREERQQKKRESSLVEEREEENDGYWHVRGGRLSDNNFPPLFLL